jgi:hypothetical protein
METQELFGCRPCRNQSEIYVMILEKCWAKLWKSYQEIDGNSFLIQVAFPMKHLEHSLVR